MGAKSLETEIEELYTKNRELSEQIKRLVAAEGQLCIAQQKLDYQMKIYKALYKLGNQFSECYDLDRILVIANEFVNEELDLEKSFLYKVQDKSASFLNACGHDEDEVSSIAVLNTEGEAYRAFMESPALHSTHSDETKEFQEISAQLDLDEFHIFKILDNQKNPMMILISGNSEESKKHYAKVQADSQLRVGLSNMINQLEVTIHNVMNHQALQAERTNLEKTVEMRTLEIVNEKKKIVQILENAPVGILTIDENMTIGEKYSPALLSILDESEESFAGGDFSKIFIERLHLSSDKREIVRSVISSIVGSDVFSFVANSHLLPRELEFISCQNRMKHLDVRWSCIENDNYVEGLLVFINDISEIKALEANSQKNQEEMKNIKKIMDLGNQAPIVLYGLKDLVSDSLQRIQNFEDHADSLTILSRNVHTIKGNARSASLNTISDAAHEFESLVEENREQLSTTLLIEGFESVAHEFDKHWDAAKRLGRIGGRDIVEVEITRIDGIIAQLKGQSFSRHQIQSELSQIVGYPLQAVIADIQAKSGELSSRIGKVEPEFSIDPGNVFFKAKYLNLLKDAFGHLVRNSLDHGIETPEVRRQLGKRPQGRIVTRVRVSSPWVYIEYQDDGRGLDLEKLKAKGLEKNLITPEVNDPQIIADLVFAKNLSTKNEVTLLSGRGIGMDAVQAIVRQNLAGDVYLELLERRGKYAPFVLQLKLPLDTIY